METDTKIERRSFAVAEMRASDDPESRMVTGHAAVFDVLSHPMWDFREKIAPGAFTESLKTDDVRALWNHSPDHVLGRTKSGTLKLSEDERGLAFEMDIAPTQMGNDAIVLIRRGDVSDMSFGFIVTDDSWEQEPGELATRTLKVVSLLDVSPVAFPAYPETNIAVRSLNAWREIEAESKQPSLEMRRRQVQLAELEA